MNNSRESIEADIKKLEQIVAWFEGDEFSLEEAITRYEEAQVLADSISKRLQDLKNKIIDVKSSK